MIWEVMCPAAGEASQCRVAATSRGAGALVHRLGDEPLAAGVVHRVAEEVGVLDVAGGDDVHRDPVRAQLAGQVVGVGVQGRLGGGVGAAPRAAVGGDGAEEQHPSAGLGQPALEGLGEQDGGQRVDPEVGHPVVGHEVERILPLHLGLQLPRAARAVDQHVHGAHLVGHEPRDAAQRGHVAHVGGVRQRAGHLRLAQHLLAPPEQQDPVAVGREQLGRSQTDARTTTTDHHVARHDHSLGPVRRIKSQGTHGD